MLPKPLKYLKLLAVIASVLAPPTMAGTPIVYTDGDKALFQVEAPDFWNVRTGGIRTLTAPEREDFREVSRIFGMTPAAHEGIWVGFVSPHGVTTLDGARAYLKEIGQFLVKDAVVEDTKNRRIGGLPAQSFSGTGRRGTKTVNFTAITIDLPNGRVAVSIVVIENGSDVEIIDDINEMMASFKAIR